MHEAARASVVRAAVGVTRAPVGRTRRNNEPPIIIDPNDRTGSEDITLEETLDYDSAVPLERAYRANTHKGGTSPAGFEPAFWP